MERPELRKCWCLVYPGGIVEGTLVTSRIDAMMLHADRAANGHSFDLEHPLEVGEAVRRFQSLYLGG